MDNNHYNDNRSSDSFYSYNNTSQGSSYGSGNYNSYQQDAYGGYSSAYRNVYQENGDGGKKKKKKSGGFGIKLVKCAVLALVFGAVGGVAFQGARYATAEIIGVVEPAAKEEDKEGYASAPAEPEQKQADQTPAITTMAATNDVSGIVENVMPSIVAITNVSQTEYRSFWGGMPQTYEDTSAGSGIIANQDAEYLYIVTNNHVVEGATSLTVTFEDSTTVSADVKGTDPSTDLAVIRVALGSIEGTTKELIKVAAFGNSDNLKVGEASIAIGNALGYGQSVTTGCISALNREVSVSDATTGTSYIAELIQTDAAINPGNSGGALLNASGEVIGINSVKYSDTSVEGIGYAIPVNTAWPIIEDLITKEKVDEKDSAFLGIAGVDVTNDVSGTYNMPTGVYVAQVTSGSAAEKAGIQKGDIITMFDGKEITSMEELSTRLQYYKAGENVQVTIMRASNGEYLEQVLDVELGKKIS